IEYVTVRLIKQRALEYAFKRFVGEELARGSSRASSFLAFAQAEAEWLLDYTLFRALRHAHREKPWWEWAPALRDRTPEGVAEANVALSNDILYFAYLQWIAHTQWRAMRGELRRIGVELMGDLPFMVARDSADVWANPGEFKLPSSVGAPPDMFN